MVYWNLDNFEFPGYNSNNKFIPKFITIRDVDRGKSQQTSPEQLFLRPELSQISYNIIKDHMTTCDKINFESYVNNFYANGIAGMEKFNDFICFKTVMNDNVYAALNPFYV